MMSWIEASSESTRVDIWFTVRGRNKDQSVLERRGGEG